MTTVRSRTPSPPRNVSQDFVFGTLATDDLRLAQIRAAGAGVLHGHDLRPQDPLPAEAITVGVTLGPAVGAEPRTYRPEGAGPALAFATDDDVGFDGDGVSLPAYAGALLAHSRSGSVAPVRGDPVG
jgi:hypothetical protein